MNCKICNSKDQIEIAGKTFCANCGAVNSFVDNNTNPDSTTPDSQIKPTFQIQPAQQPDAQNPTSNNPPPSIQNSGNNMQPVTQTDNSTIPVQSTPINPINTSNQTINNYSQPPVQAPNPTNIPQPVYTQAQPQPSPQVNNINNSTPTPQNVVTTSNTQTPPVSVQNPSNIQPNPQTQNSPSQQIGSNTVPNLGNEIGQLSKKDNMAFSDDELEQLANDKTPAPNVINPFADIANDYDKSNQKTRLVNDISKSGVRNSPVTVKPPAPINTPPNQSTNLKPQNTTNAQPSPQSTINSANSNTSNTNSAQDNRQADIIAGQVDQPKKESKLKKHGSKVASVGLSLAGVILLGIYVWQINYPNLALKVAGSKAGISASLPAYLPNGWKISGDIQANPGSISYKLATAEGDKSVAINQVRSDWDSQALAENYLAPNTDKYTALQAEGLTIYIYNNNQASWVNHGTWYRIEGQDHGLSKDQIIKMATSL